MLAKFASFTNNPLAEAHRKQAGIYFTAEERRKLKVIATGSDKYKDMSDFVRTALRKETPEAFKP